MTEYDSRRLRVRRFRTILVVALVTMLVAGGLTGYLLLTHPRQAEARRDETVVHAEQAMRTFATAWSSRDLAGAARLTDSPEDAESLLTSLDKNLKPSAFKIKVGRGEAERTGQTGGPVVVPFTVTMTVPQVGAFTYASKARVVVQPSGTPLVAFIPSVVHPQLKPGQTLAVAKMPTRGSILDRKGNVLTAASLVGQVDEQTGKGVSGLQERYDEQLRGSAPAFAVAVTDRDSGKALKPLWKQGARVGRDVHTTIDPDVQSAAADALEHAATPAALIAIKPSSGDVLAVANHPGGFNRALIGEYPPGSTFKVITAAALLESGLQPSDALQCPKYEWVNGYRFANQGEFTLPDGSTFLDAFAHSCNTAFVHARDRIDDDTLAETAQAFGIGGEWDTGAATFDGSVPKNSDANDKAAAMIGQARDLASPLVMASVAATVKSGRFVQPRLVPEAVDHPYQAPRNLDPQVVTNLQSMMRSVVTDGSGDALRDLPGEPHAKTGTAEYGGDKPPRTHAWMIGYQQDSDIAWAVLLEDGGSGGSDAGPIAAAFLKGLSTK